MVAPLPNFEILSRLGSNSVSPADLVFRLLTFLELLNSNFYFLFCDLVTRRSSLTSYIAHPARSIVSRLRPAPLDCYLAASWPCRSSHALHCFAFLLFD